MMTVDFKFNHGDQVKDTVTGFAGTITGCADYMTGCKQYLVVTKWKKDSTSEPACLWCDEDRLVLVKSSAWKVKESPNTGGPQSHPPGKH